MSQPIIPIIFQEHLQLTDIGINPEEICIDTVTMESDRFICVKQTNGEASNIVIIDMEDPGNPKRRKITAELAIMHPMLKVIALRGINSVKIYNLETKRCIKSHTIEDDVLYMRWISLNILALVTNSSVYHWSMEGDSTPMRAFDTDKTLAGCRIINYQCDATQKWLLITGLTSIPNRVVGVMELYSVDGQCSQPFEGYAASFVLYKIQTNPDPSILLCFAVRTVQGIRLNITEVGHPPISSKPFNKKSTDIYFPPEAQYDYPVAIQISTKFEVAYLVTNYGFIHVYDIGTAHCICMHRISADTIFITVPHQLNGGILGVNRTGQVLSVTIDEKNIIPYIAYTLQKPKLARRMALRNNLVGAPKIKRKIQKRNYDVPEINDEIRSAM